MMSRDSYVVAVISPNRKVHEEIASALEGNPHAEALWAVGDYPDSSQMAKIREAPDGCIVFLDFSDILRAKSVAAELDRGYPNAAVVALHAGNQPQVLIELMQLGIREVLNLPASATEIARAVTRAGRKLRKETEANAGGGSVFAFMPAKPGAGATTIALHAAAAAARLSGQKILLIDFDLRLGMTSFLFKLHGETSVLDALKLSDGNMDFSLWDRLVCRRGTLDILGSAPAEFGCEIPEQRAPVLLESARQFYPSILADLPGDMRNYEYEILNRAKEIFLVCVPDIGSLHMAKKKADMLRRSDLANKTSVIMNRAGSRGAMSVSDLEGILDLPVRFSVDSADKEIQAASHKGAAIEGRSTIATQIANIGRHTLPVEAAAEQQSGARRFIDFFSVTPIRDKAAWKR